MILKVAAVGALLTTVAACSSTVTGSGTADTVGLTAPSSTAAASTPVSSAAASTPAPSTSPPAASAIVPSSLAWTANSDTATGVGFDLPGRATHKSSTEKSNGFDVVESLYTVELGGTKGLGVSVGVLHGASERLVWNVDKYISGFVEEFTAVGATDAKILERKTSTIDGHKVVDFRFSFTSQSATAGQSVWLIRVIADGGNLLVAQTVGFAVDPATLLPAVRTIQARLVSGLRPA